MALSQEQLRLLTNDRYPLSAKYDPEWIVQNQVGSHCLWLMESLVQVMDLKPGMRVLDLGCGKAITSIFLAKEFGVQVWANDLWTGPTENWKRICEAGVGHLVYPIRAEAHDLPYADGFFDAVVAINSLQFFATDDYYLKQHLVRLLTPDGRIGAIVPGVYREMGRELPEHLRPHWDSDFYSWHSPDWWRWHWARTGLVEVETADTLPDGQGAEIFRRFEQVIRPEGGMVTTDDGRNITFVRIVARRAATP